MHLHQGPQISGAAHKGVAAGPHPSPCRTSRRTQRSTLAAGRRGPEPLVGAGAPHSTVSGMDATGGPEHLLSGCAAVQDPGYHTVQIPKGELGELSKIHEELLELADAAAQGVKIMELVELSDLLGAIDAYLATHHPGTTIDDLAAMSAVTARAFRAGRR